MKRFFFSFLLLIAAAGALQAQSKSFTPEWCIGVNGGATLSRMGFLPSVPQTMLVQGVGGLTVRYVSEKNCGIQAELNYSLRGWKEAPDTLTNPHRYSRSVAYLELPILTHFYFDVAKRARVAINLGPQISYALAERVLEREIVLPEGAAAVPPPLYYADNYRVQRPFDYGITGGLGLEIRTGIGHFVLEGRYYYGLSDVFNNTRSDVFQSSHNQVVNIKLSYLWRWR
jgi:hypothetical protein